MFGKGPEAEAHWRVCLRLAGVVPAAVCAPMPMGAPALASSYACTAACDRCATLLAGTAPDVIDIAGTLPDACPVSLSVLARTGLPLLCARMSGETVAAADRIIRAVTRGRGRVCLTQSLRFHPAMARLYEFATSGALGTVRRVEVKRAAVSAEVDPETCGEAAAAEELWADLQHRDIDLCNWFLGCPRAVSVHSGGRGGSEWVASRIVIRYADGGEAWIETGPGSPVGALERTVTVHGDLGAGVCQFRTLSAVAAVPDDVRFIEIRTADGARRLRVPSVAPLRLELGYLAGALVRGGICHGVDLVQGRTALAVREAARIAMAGGDPVPIP